MHNTQRSMLAAAIFMFATCAACALFLQSNKVPQERVPADVADKITREMLDAFQQVLGPPGTVKLPRPVFTK